MSALSQVGFLLRHFWFLSLVNLPTDIETTMVPSAFLFTLHPSSLQPRPCHKVSFFFCCPTAYGIPRPGVISERQLLRKPQLLQCWILNPPCLARDQTCVPALQGYCWSCCSTVVILAASFLAAVSLDLLLDLLCNRGEKDQGALSSNSMQNKENKKRIIFPLPWNAHFCSFSQISSIYWVPPGKVVTCGTADRKTNRTPSLFWELTKR